MIVAEQKMPTAAFTKVIREKPLRSISVSLQDLRTIANIVIDKNRDAIELEHAFIRKLDLDAETRQKYLDIVDNNQQVTIFVNGNDGDNLVANDPEIFSSHALPAEIVSITIESQTHRQVRTNANPPNFARIHFDFSKLRFSSPNITPGGGVLNISALRIEGDNPAWVIGTFSAIDERLNALRNARTILHGSSTYQMILFFLALPVSALVFDEIFSRNKFFFDSLGPVSKFGALIYAVLFAAIFFRLFFNYALWAFPSVELMQERDISAKHRKFWFTVITGLLISAISFYVFRR